MARVSFKSIQQRAAKRKGGPKALASLMPKKPNNKALARVPDDRILSEIGIEIRDDEEALQLFRDAGATVNGVLVRFDPGHAKALCSTAPAEFTQLARNPERSVRIGGRNVVLAPAYGSPFVHDRDNGRRELSITRKLCRQRDSGETEATQRFDVGCGVRF